MHNINLRELLYVYKITILHTRFQHKDLAGGH